jgi:signal transduction histidine kinase
VWDIFPALRGAPFEHAFQAALAGASPATFAVQCCNRWFDVSLFPVDAGVATIFRDVTSRELTARERDRRAELRERLLGIVGHDLRGPLTAIVMSASALLRDPGLDPSRREHVARIARGADRMQRMIRQLLDFTRFRLGGGVNVEPVRVDLDQLVREVVDEVRAGHPGVRLEIDAAGPLVGFWDRDRVGEVIANLVANAVEHGRERAPVRVTLRGDDGEAVVSVHNDGDPIPEELVGIIFDPFRRVAEHRRRSSSLGLGLYISREFVLSHGGSLEVASTADEGTTFLVRLPRGRPPLAST